jgi:hypothetical protein
MDHVTGNCDGLRGSECNRRTGCGKTARPGLCGGLLVTGVPTARSQRKWMSTESFIAKMPWSRLCHAYGRATDAPRAFKDLLGQDQDARDEVYYDWLYSAVFHQYTMYSATPSAIRAVLYILENEDLTDLEVMGRPLGLCLLEWLYSCARSSQGMRRVQAALREGRACYEAYVSNRDQETADLAESLIEFCSTNRQTE